MSYPNQYELKEFEESLTRFSPSQIHRMARSSLDYLSGDLKHLRERMDAIEHTWQCWYHVWVKYEMVFAKVQKIPQGVSGKANLDPRFLTREEKEVLLNKLLTLEEGNECT